MEKKIICLIRNQPEFIYFVNKINESHKVSLVIIEASPAIKNIKKGVMLGNISCIIDVFLNQLSKIRKRGQWRQDYASFFKNKWSFLDEGIRIVRTGDIDSPAVLDLLIREKADLILVHGTSILKGHILRSAALSLNLHWGLSPYYRGRNCTEWALINRDPLNIGVTIHKLTGILDGGDILAQQRASVKSSDTVHSINMQLTVLGAELLVKIIGKIRSGEQLRFYSQDYSRGFLTFGCQWSSLLQRHVEYIEKQGFIGQIIKHPSRNVELPIVGF